MLVIFDLDGTLIDTKQEILAVFSQAFENLGKKLDYSKMEKNIGLPLEELLEALLGKYDKRFEEEIKRIYYSHRERKIRIFPGLDELIKNDGFKKAILTSKRRKTALTDLKYLGIDNYFPIIIGADDVEKRKPCKEGIEKIIELANCKDRKKVFMVGDTEMDILAAKRAGVKSVAVTWGFRDENFLKKYEPDYIARNSKELKDILGL